MTIRLRVENCIQMKLSVLVCEVFLFLITQSCNSFLISNDASFRCGRLRSTHRRISSNNVFPRNKLSQLQVHSALTTSETAKENDNVAAETTSGISVSTDPEYPYLFTGRLWFSPSLVKVPTEQIGKSVLTNKKVDILSIFGYTLGGTVTLEYDTSPVGPYKEFVTMSSLVMKRSAVGQWGSRLYVSTQEAEDVCRDVWGVPAEVANIKFSESNSAHLEEDEADVMKDPSLLTVVKPPNPFAKSDDIQDICVEGWKNTRVLQPDEYNTAEGPAKRWGNLPVLWTPTIKALWSPWLAGGFQSIEKDDMGETELPLHKLRLSASAIRLSWSGFSRKLDRSVDAGTREELGIPLGVGLVVDNVLIEIGKPWGKF